MATVENIFGRFACWLLLVASACWLTACATQVAPPTDAEALPDAVTVPYRISSAGRFIIDISVNGQDAKPFVIDTGATISVIYENHARSLGLSAVGQSIVVRGLIAIEARPTIEDIEFQIGAKTFQLDHIVTLETPETTDEAVGLLGVDVLADYAVVFNKEAMTATIVPSGYVSSRTFSGWRRIPLRKRVDFYPDYGLHFSQTTFEQEKVPVLIDTGSSLNIVNWPLATLDDDMRRFQRRLRDEAQLQGANEASSLTVETLFNDLILGGQYWPKIKVIVMELDTLSTVAPVDEPLMIAGAGMLTPWTIAIDFGGDILFVRANPDDPRPPSRTAITTQSRFARLPVDEESTPVN